MGFAQPVCGESAAAVYAHSMPCAGKVQERQQHPTVCVTPAWGHMEGPQHYPAAQRYSVL